MKSTHAPATSAICEGDADDRGPTAGAGVSERRPTRVTVVRAAELTSQHVDAWSRIQRGNPVLDSPFFRPEFVQQVARFRSDVEVAVLECDGQAIGFFAFV